MTIKHGNLTAAVKHLSLQERLLLAVRACKELVETHSEPGFPVFLCGVVGPAGCGFDGNAEMTAEEAKRLHEFEVCILN